MMGACRGGQELRVTRLLKRKPGPNQYIYYYAAKGQNMKVIELLKADGYRDYYCGLSGACYVGNVELMQFFIGLGARYTYDAMNCAFLSDNNEIIEMCAKQFDDITFSLLSFGNLARFNELLNKYDEHGRLRAMRQYIDLIRDGASYIPIDVIINQEQNKLLLDIACRYGNYKWVQAFTKLDGYRVTHCVCMDKVVIKSLMDSRKISFADSDMFKLYKINDGELIRGANGLPGTQLVIGGNQIVLGSTYGPKNPYI